MNSSIRLRLLPATALFLFFLNLANAQSFQMQSGGIRRQLTLKNGVADLRVCDLVEGQSYTVLLNGLPGTAGAEWLPAAGEPARREALNAREILRFTANSACMDLPLSVRTPAPVSVYLSIGAAGGKSPAPAKKSAVPLEIVSGMSPAELIADHLFGNGCYQVSNVTFTGQPGSIGSFSGGQANILLDHGMVMATGEAHVVEGPNDSDIASNGYGVAVYQDPNLAALAGGAQFDLSLIEFDVTVFAPSLSFQFVFGSEEYCEYIGTQFNDVFGIFISGPGIAGVKNMALVPNTNIPVSLTSVNHVVNADYYVNNLLPNGCNNQLPFAFDECEMDGWTKMITGSAQVIPCSTYHIKIAIADLSDGISDSAIFLRAAPGGNSPSVEASVEYPDNQDFAYESCQNGFVVLERGNAGVNLPLTVHFSVAGTATPGVDYAPLSSPVVIPAGQTEMLIPVTVFGDALTEGDETIVLAVDNSCTCSPTLTYLIKDHAPLSVLMPDTMLCGGGAIIGPAVAGGIPPYTYKWNTGATGDELFVVPGIYSVTVTDACGLTLSADAIITQSPPPPFGVHIYQFCEGDTLEVFGLVFTQSGIALYEAPGQNGQCDTSFNIFAQEVQEITRTVTVGLCPGQPFTVGGNTYFAPATVAVIEPGLNGACDTVSTYKLVATPFVPQSRTRTFCQGESVTIDGTVYTGPGTVEDTIPGTAGCDTLITYTLAVLPLTTLSDTVFLCPGETFVVAGQPHAAPASVTVTLPGNNGQCDTLLTYHLLLLTPAPSTVKLDCPAPVALTIAVDAALPVVDYPGPAGNSDCSCPGLDIQQTGGLASGSVFPLGVTSNCFMAKDLCGNAATCCFSVKIMEEPPCDVKTSGCVKWEILSVEEDGELNVRYRVRVTNNCPNKLVSAYFQLPAGLAAEEPSNNSVYTSPGGNDYGVINPNLALFYSIRFNTLLNGISGGGSDIFEYVLPPQTDVLFIQALVRLSPSVYYSTHLNTFDCEGSQSRSAEPGISLKLFPNPVEDLLFVDLPEGDPDIQLPVRIWDGVGACILKTALRPDEGSPRLELPKNLRNGMYIMEIRFPGGKTELRRFTVLK